MTGKESKIVYSLEEFVEHPIVDVFRPGAVKLGDLLRVGTVAVQRAELAAGIPEQHQEMLALRARDLFQHASLGLRVYGAGKHAVFDRVQHYTAIGLRGRLFV